MAWQQVLRVIEENKREDLTTGPAWWWETYEGNLYPIHSAHERKSEKAGSWDEARSAESKSPMRTQTKPVLQMSCRQASSSIQSCEWEGHGAPKAIQPWEQSYSQKEGVAQGSWTACITGLTQTASPSVHIELLGDLWASKSTKSHTRWGNVLLCAH